MKRLFFGMLVLLLVTYTRLADSQDVSVVEASGIVRQGDNLLIVGDEDSGRYFRYSLTEGAGGAIPIDPARTIAVRLSVGGLAEDLEAIGVLADETVVVLSERLRALISDNGIVVEYDKPLSEFAGRGLEGLSIRRLQDGSSRIGVLWEGGYPEYSGVPTQLQRAVGRKALRPVVWIHDVPAGATGLKVSQQDANVIELQVPVPGGLEPNAQRFRAPDLVWSQEGNGFIVLLSSENSPEYGKPTYGHQWIQRFDLGGSPIGKPLDLKTIVPAQLKDANWEGVAWFEEGKRLILIHDKPPRGQATAFVVDLPEEW